MAAERSRWQRDHHSRERAVKRKLYGEYLAALSLATHQLRDLRRANSLAPDERVLRAGEILSRSGVYQMRYQMLITTPDGLEDIIEQAFNTLRILRDRINNPDVHNDSGWDEAIDAINDVITTLKRGIAAAAANGQRACVAPAVQAAQ